MRWLSIVWIATWVAPAFSGESLAMVESRLTEMAADVRSVKATMTVETRKVFDQWLANRYARGTKEQQLAMWRAGGVGGLVPVRATGTYKQSAINGVVCTREALDLTIGGAVGNKAPAPSGFGHRKSDENQAEYTPTKSDFALGYLLNGVTNLILGREQEADERFQEAVATNCELASIVARLRGREFNTVVVADWGIGPQKIAFGPDDTLTRFEPNGSAPSDFAVLRVTVNGVEAGEYPVACDLNLMSQDHMWNNLGNWRKAKSHAGTAMMMAGAAAMTSSDNRGGGALVGLGFMLAGAAVKASARADTRYCEIMPQRVYLAAVTVSTPGTTLTFEIDGKPESRLLLCGVDPPAGDPPVQFLYVRLPVTALPWAVSDQVVYANDAYQPRVAAGDLPYILGGRCVCRPSEQVLARYQAAGKLEGMTLSDLESLYRAEGIKLSIEEEGGRAGLHVLEGGNSLHTPVVGSVGFKRLFCQEHPAYVPKSAQVRALIAQYANQDAAQATAR